MHADNIRTAFSSPRLFLILLLLCLLFYIPVHAQERRPVTRPATGSPFPPSQKDPLLLQQQISDPRINTSPQYRQIPINRAPQLNSSRSEAPTISASGRKVKNNSRNVITNTSVPLPACVDSSFKKLFWSPNRIYYFYTMAKTRDGGILVSGTGTDTLENGYSKYYAPLLKFDQLGNFLWATEIRGDIKSDMSINTIYEMQDGNILVGGNFGNSKYATDPNNSYSDFMLLKLTPTGDIIWTRTYHSSSPTCTYTATVTLEHIRETSNKDILLSGQLRPCGNIQKNEIAIKLDANGHLLWDQSFEMPNALNGEAFSIFQRNNEVWMLGKVGGLFSGTDGHVNIHCLRMDLATGQYLGEKAFVLDYLPWWEQYNVWAAPSSNFECTELSNGDLLVTGGAFGALMTPNPEKHHFTVLRFSPSFDFISGFNIKSGVASNWYNDRIDADSSGTIQFSFIDVKSSFDADLYTAALTTDRQFLYQRKQVYSGIGMPGNSGHLKLNDGGHLFMQTHYRTADQRFYFEFDKTYPGDSAGNCNGIDTSFARTVNLHYRPYSNWNWQITSNILQSTVHDISQKAIYFTPVDGCQQTTFCDTVAIHGPDKICDFTQPILYTAFRNKECNTWVNWRLQGMPDSLCLQREDTTVQLLINQAFKGYLYASIKGKCGLEIDSLYIEMAPPLPPLYLGKDTAICPQNTIELDAGQGYETYKWSNNSTSQSITVDRPGTYSVEATDQCGTVFTDEIIVDDAPPVPVDLGADRIKCNRDTIRLHAPSGFLNYSWGQDYEISSQTDQHVIVNPDQDTIYTIKAEKTPGCFGFDTVRIVVHHSPPVFLGNDTSLCKNKTLPLEVNNPQFVQFSWSNGASSNATQVSTAGEHTVTATTAEGCASKDTIIVNSIYPLPVVQLDKNTGLCKDEKRMLDAGGGFSSYVWNDGSTNRRLMADGLGTFSVTVTDQNGCEGTDQTNISVIHDLPSGFLPKDTTICTYSKFTLKSLQTYQQYNWSNNTSQSSILVTQPGQYWLEVQDANACKGKDTIVVHKKDCLYGLFVPNAFTPNNDGKNDLLRALIFGPVELFEFTIYNRYGQVIFRTTDPYKGWDGTINGQTTSSNQFVWTCRYRLGNDPIQVEKGTVLVIR